eukprot:TRINITY_DN24163_c0_g1_i1.p1 TRINITY_DN24163_c0_g1~~TRINITY_DN24163_c0_g1_i1.p1  ORF type:complete len:1054 (-),score=148.76 TRINITY_DN24163_c0_g1_i1:68-3229(-)
MVARAISEGWNGMCFIRRVAVAAAVGVLHRFSEAARGQIAFSTDAVFEDGDAWSTIPTAEVETRHTAWPFPVDDQSADAVELLRFITPFRRQLDAFVDVTPYSPLLRAGATTNNVLTVYAFIDTWVGNDTSQEIWQVNSAGTCKRQNKTRRATLGNGWQLYADLLFWPRDQKDVDTRPRDSLTLGAGIFNDYPLGGIEVHEGWIPTPDLDAVHLHEPVDLTGVQEIAVFDCPIGTKEFKADMELQSVAKLAIQSGRARRMEMLQKKVEDFRQRRVAQQLLEVIVTKSAAETDHTASASDNLLPIEEVYQSAPVGQMANTGSNDSSRESLARHAGYLIKAAFSSGKPKNETTSSPPQLSGQPVYFRGEDVVLDDAGTSEFVIGEVKKTYDDGTLDIAIKSPCRVPIGTRLLTPEHQNVMKEANHLAQVLLNIGKVASGEARGGGSDQAILLAMQAIERADTRHGGGEDDVIDGYGMGGLGLQTYGKEHVEPAIPPDEPDDLPPWMPALLRPGNKGSVVKPAKLIGSVDFGALRSVEAAGEIRNAKMDEGDEERKPPLRLPLRRPVHEKSLLQQEEMEEETTQGASLRGDVAAVGQRRVCLVTRQVSGQLLKRSFMAPAVGEDERALMQLAITGHGWDGSTGSCGEFCETHYAISMNGEHFKTVTFWRDDCDRNPLFDQGGTWDTHRNGWCPGSVGPGLFLDASEPLRRARGGPTTLSIDVSVRNRKTNEFVPYTNYAQIRGSDSASLFVGLTLFVYDAPAVQAVLAQTQAYTAAEKAIRDGCSAPEKLVSQEVHLHREAQYQPFLENRSGIGVMLPRERSNGERNTSRSRRFNFEATAPWYNGLPSVRTSMTGQRRQSATERRSRLGRAGRVRQTSEAKTRRDGAWKRVARGDGRAQAGARDGGAPGHRRGGEKEGIGGARAAETGAAEREAGGGMSGSGNGVSDGPVVVSLLGHDGVLVQGTSEGRLHRIPVVAEALPETWGQVGLHLRLGKPAGILDFDHFDRVSSLGLVLPASPPASAAQGEPTKETAEDVDGAVVARRPGLLMLRAKSAV